MRLARVLSASTGVVAVVLVVASSFFEAVPPDKDAEAEEVRDHYAEAGPELSYRLAALFVAMGFLLWFVGHARDRTGPIGFGAGILVVGLWLVALAVEAAPFLLDLEAASDSRVETLFAFGLLGEAVGDAGTVPRAVFVGATSLALVRGARRTRWLGWSGFPVALLCAGGALFPIPFGPWGTVWFAGFALYLLWLFAFALVVVAGTVRDRPASPTGATERA